jgi:predicted nucleic acid-binding Zn ribbon protein
MIYQYECPGDNEIVEIERSINEPEIDYACGLCGAKMRRIYNATPTIFKGSGFYTTDKSK